MTPTDLPTFEATWWPVVLETIPSAGEHIVVAMLVRGASGQAQVRQVIAPHTLTSMFGRDGKGMQMVVGTTVLQLQQQLDVGVRVQDLEFPFGGIALGRARDCVANDLNEVFDMAVRMGAAFGVSTFGSREAVARETQIAFDDWADRVRDQVAVADLPIELSALFNVRVVLPSRRKSRIGFLHAGHAANLGVLRPGHSSADTRALKLKLFDLEVFRRNQPLTIQTTEVIVGCPSLPADSVYSPREHDNLEASWHFIASEAKARNITPVRCQKPVDAANHLLALLRA